MRLFKLAMASVFIGLLANSGWSQESLLTGDRPFGMEEIQKDFSSLSREDLVLVQSLLQQYGFYEYTIDGLWGPGTAQALYEAQTFFAEAGWKIGDGPEENVPTSYVAFVLGKAAFAAYD